MECSVDCMQRCYLESCSCSVSKTRPCAIAHIHFRSPILHAPSLNILPRQEATPGRFKVSSVLSRHPGTFPPAQPAQIHRQEEGLALNLRSTVITLRTGGRDPARAAASWWRQRHLLCGPPRRHFFLRPSESTSSLRLSARTLELDTKPRSDNTLHTALSQARRESLHRWEPWADTLEE
jgi:hypothetical protein